MTITIPEDALDPIVRKIGEVAGLLSDDDSPSVRDEFLAHPLDELSHALRDRQDAVIELLGQVLGDSNAEVLGMPAGGTQDHWIPIRDPDGGETGLYIVLSRKPPSLIVGLGWKWEATENLVTVRTWAHVPILKTAGTGPSTRLAVATAEAPVKIAAEVSLEGGFGVEGMRFRGVRGVVSVGGITAPPDVALVLLGLEMGESPAQDKSLADLAALPAAAWIETAVSLFTAQLSAAGAGSAATIVKDFLLPLMGVTAPSPMVRLRWEELPQRGLSIFDDWFNSMVGNPAAMRAWLGKWQALLQSGAGVPLTANVAGSGTRADPWRAEVPVAGTVRIAPTAAVETRPNGTRVLYLGFRVGSTPFSVGSSNLRLDLTGAAEIVAIPIGSTAPVSALPSLSVMLQLTSTTGTLVSHTFSASDPLAAMGTLAVGSLEAGVALDSQQRPVPHLALRNVQCARGSWETIDLSSADAVLDGIGGVASNLIQQQIEQGLALGAGGQHAGRHVAALLGLVAPTAGSAPSPWPVTLVTDSARITQFLGNPLAAVARYHSDCLKTDIAGAPAWRFLLAELGLLLQENGATLPGAGAGSGAGSIAIPLSGTGTTDRNWRLVLGRTDAGDLVLKASFDNSSDRPQLKLGVAFEPRELSVGDASVTLALSADLFSISLPTALDGVGPSGTWLPQMSAEIRVVGDGGVTTPPLGALRLGAESLSLALLHTPSSGIDWRIELRDPWASWDGVGLGIVSLPPLRLDSSGATAWDLSSDTLDGSVGGVGRDAVAELSRFVVGYLALEHGGPVGFGLSALLGLLPADPKFALPSEAGGIDPGFALPADFPALSPDDWGQFFADPWPTVRAHLLRVMAEPRFTRPALQWLRAAFQGLSPQRGGTHEILTFPEAIGGAGTFIPPGGTDSTQESHEPLGFPSLEAVPLTLGGDGTYESPYTLALRSPALRNVQALLWLDPDGPPSGNVVDAALAILAPALRDLANLGSASLDQLADVLSALADVDRAVADALQSVSPSAVSNSLDELQTLLATSDGVILTASQQPSDASWTRPAPLAADHVHALDNSAVISAIQSQSSSWDSGAGLPVLMLSAPFEANDAWQALSASLGVNETSFSFRVPGVSPVAVSLLSLDSSARTIAAELAVYDESPGLSASARIVPVDAPAPAASQADQVARLVDRLRGLHSGKKVIVVAHSASGLAARAAVQRPGLSGAVRGIITVSTPHLGSALPWQDSPTIGEAVGTVERLSSSFALGSPVGPALDTLWTFISGKDAAGEQMPWPAHAFAPSGPATLPAGVGGLALATKLPAGSLQSALASAIAAYATSLRTALTARAPVDHIGVGLSLGASSSTASTLDVKVRTRLDIGSFLVASGGSPRTTPKLVITAILKRRDGWLVGAPDARARVRWAELGCEISSGGITPRVRLHNAAVDGVEATLATLQLLSDGSWQPDEILAPALDAMLAELTTSAGSADTGGATAGGGAGSGSGGSDAESLAGVDSTVLSLVQLLRSLDITKLRGATESTGYAINPDGWSALLADGRASMQRVLADVIADATKRDLLVSRLRSLFGFTPNDLSKLLAGSPSDPPEWRALRALLQSLGLLKDDVNGSVPVISAWLELFGSPSHYLRTHVSELLGQPSIRTNLLSELRAILGLGDVGSPVVERSLGAGLTIRVEALGRVSIQIAGESALSLGNAASISGLLELDLVNGSASTALRFQPNGIVSGLVWQMSIPASAATPTSQIALDFGDGARISPYELLPIYPVPADLPARLGDLLPRVVVSTVATALLDGVVLPNAPQLAGPLAYLGLVDPGVVGERPRFRNISRLVADPRGWLLSSGALGATGVGASSTPSLSSTRVAGLVREAAMAFNFADSSGNIALPYGLRVATAIAPSARLTFSMPAPLALRGGVTIAVNAEIGWTAAGTLGAGGTLDLRAALPGGGPWPTLRVELGIENGAFRVALGADDAMLQLLPFSGFDAGALGAAAARLLPTVLDALLDALEANGNADVAAFISRVRAAATTLEIDTLPHLDAIVSDPIAWMRHRFSAANAPASASALNNVLLGVPGFSVVGGKLQFQPAGSPVAVTVGRNGSIGAAVALTALDLGPVTLGASFSAGIPDSGPVAPVVNGSLDISVDEGVIAPAGVSIGPSLHFGIGTSGLSLYLYPIGNVAGSPDFRLDVLPAFSFGVDDGGTIEGALLEFARRVLVPVVIETFLDTSDVTTWLNTSIHAGLKPGVVLQDAGLLISDGGTGWNLVALDTLADPIRLVEGLIGAAMRATSAAFGATPIIDFSGAGGPGAGLFAASAVSAGKTTYGIRVALPELRLSEDPEIIVRLGGRSDWISAAGGPVGVGAGLSFLVVRDNGAGTNPRFAFDPVLEMAGVGISVSGRGDEPLFDVSGFRLGGLEALLYLRVSNLLTTPQVAFGLYGDISNIAIPLGTSDSNPVAASLMSGGGDSDSGDSEPVNPQFSVRAAYVQNFWLEIGGDARNEVWFPIQRTFGPVSIQQIGVRWIGGPASKLAVLLDGGVALGGLAVGVDDLSLTMPLARISHINEWELGLRGLAVSYNAGGVKIAGGLLQASDEIRYDGFLLIEVGGKSFVAFGSYGVVDGDTSLFVFLVVGIPIGGPPYFFITGLAGGFGYNRGLVVPPIEGVPAFPLVSAMSDPGVITDDPMGFLRTLSPSFPMERGSYWFAAGLKFTSFTLVNSQALLYVLLNRGLEIGILGMSQMELPPAVPLVSIELALKARFSTIEGVISVEARLTDNSWLLSRDCRLTGGFAFFLWFSGEHSGDFVITIGGYHPRYTKPAHYPNVPRLGFNWRVGSKVTIKGEAYFALTPREVMAGGLLEASYHSGDVKAWFRAWANMYVQWRPFWFEVDIGISIGVSVDTWLGTVKVEVGASLWLWGPEVGGEVEVDLWIVSFTVRFGASYNKPTEALSWSQFRTALLPPEDDKLYSGNVERGLITGSPATGPWTVLPEFILRTDVFLGTSQVKFGVASAISGGTAVEIDIKPMRTPVNIMSLHMVRVIRVRDGLDMTSRFQEREVLRGNIPRALWDTSTANPSQSIMPGVTGARLVAEFDRTRLDSTGSIPWTKLFETGRRHPLPFTPELTLRASVGELAGKALQYDLLASRTSDALFASGLILQDGLWKERRKVTLDALAAEGVRVTPSKRDGDVAPRGTFRRGRRSSPPLVRSLYEGLSAEATLFADRKETLPDTVKTPPKVSMYASLSAVIRQRVEPTRAAARSMRTTVNGTSKVTELARNAREVDMSALLEGPVAGATVLTSAPSRGVRESTIARTMPTLRRGLGTASRDIALLDAAEKAAWGGARDRDGGPGGRGGGGGGERFSFMAGVDAESGATRVNRPLGSGPADNDPLAAQRLPGVPVDPGSTLRFVLPTRNVDDLPPAIRITGDAAVRITALDRGGNALLDIEGIGTQQLIVPEGTETLMVCGLGRAARKQVQGATGAVTLTEATSPIPVVGWQSQSELVVADATTLLARGALVTLASRITRIDDAGTVIASVAIADQLGVTTTLPVAVRSIAIVLDEADGECLSTIADTLAVSARGAVLSEKPQIVAAGARTVLLYDIIATDKGAKTIAVPVACDAAWTLCGVMGFNGTATEWARLMASVDLDALVENGPLAPVGTAFLQFVGRDALRTPDLNGDENSTDDNIKDR